MGSFILQNNKHVLYFYRPQTEEIEGEGFFYTVSVWVSFFQRLKCLSDSEMYRVTVL